MAFITVTNLGGQDVVINSDNIITMYRSSDSAKRTRIFVVGGAQVLTDESPSSILEKIKHAG